MQAAVDGDVGAGDVARFFRAQERDHARDLVRPRHAADRDGADDLLQRLAWEQQPTALQDFGLLRAVDSLVAHWAERNGVTLDLQEYGLGGVRLDPDIEIAAYRLVQAMLADLAGNGEVRVASLVLACTSSRPCST